MEARVVSLKEFAAMLGVSDKTASMHMRNQRECLNVGTARHQHLRLPLAVAEEIVSGKRPLAPVERPGKEMPKERASKPLKPARPKEQGLPHVKKR